MRLLFLGRKDHEQTQEALDYCKLRFDTDYALGEWGDSLPDIVNTWQGDYMFNFLGRWILPQSVLSLPSRAAINFHPAPPEYPGFGPINWALYDNVDFYGVTCHHMTKKIDTGEIIKPLYFKIYQNDTVESVLKKTYCYELYLFYDIVDMIINRKYLPYSPVKWSGVNRKRSDLDKLAVVDITMSGTEIERRRRAVTYKQWGIINGNTIRDAKPSKSVKGTDGSGNG